MEPKISLQTLTGTFNGERNESRDTVLTPELVESLGEQAGSSILVLTLNTEGEIPESGVEVVINSDIALTDYFTNLGRTPLTYGAEVLSAVYDEETGEATGVRLLVNSPNALISLPLENKEEIETDGIEQAVFTLEAGSGYTVDAENSSSTVLFNDSLESLPVVDPPQGGFPTVSMSVSETKLVESEGNTTTFTFNVDGEVPADGLLVYVNSSDGRGALGEFDVFNAEISGGTTAFPNFAASGFYFKILENSASITVQAFDETTNPEIEEGIVEGIQEFTFELVEGPLYTVSPDAGAVSLSIADNPDSLIQVSYSVEPETLVESEATVGIHNFTLSAPPPEGGLTVTVTAEGFEEFDLAGIQTSGISGDIEILESFPVQLRFTITDINASIELPIADDGVDEGLENVTFTLQPGNNYQVNPEANEGTFNLVDTPEQIPAPVEVREPNDTISLAVATGLSAANPEVTFDSSIDYENSNRYELEEGRLYIDFTEDVDMYSVDLAAGDVLTLDIDARNTRSSDESPDTILRLFDADGNQLAQSDDDFAPDEVFGPGRQDSYLEFTAETAGTYYIGVSSFGNGEFGFDNDPYDPNVPGSGTGRSSGTYTLNLKLNEEVTAEATEIPAENGEGPTVSLSASPATYASDDSLLANALVQYTPDGSASILTLGLDVDGTIPEEGIEVYLTSDTDLSSVFSTRAPFSPGGAEVLGAVFNEEGEPIGLKVNLTSNSSIINLNLDDPDEAPSDGEETITFNLEPADGYVVDEGSFSTTIYDTIEDVPALPTVPTVGISVSETALVESEGNTTTLTFTLDAPPPPEGIVVNLNALQIIDGNPEAVRGTLGEFDVFNAEITGGNFPAPNFRANGFFFNITEQVATITVAAFDETTNPEIPAEDALEGIEEFALTLQPGVGYAIAPDAGSVNLTIADNPDSVVIPGETEEPGTEEPGESGSDLSEGNNTIPDAIVTGLSLENPTLTVSGTIDTDRATRNLVDASEDVDMYQFELKAGQTLTVDVDSIPYEIEGVEEIQRLDSELRLFDAEGNELELVTGAPAPDEIFTANRDAYLEFVAPEDGTYYVGVAQLGNRTYDPFEAGTGSGRIFPDFGINIGEYELTATLEEAPPTEPVVSISTTTPEINEELQPEIEFTFTVEGEIPDDGQGVVFTVAGDGVGKLFAPRLFDERTPLVFDPPDGLVLLNFTGTEATLGLLVPEVTFTAGLFDDLVEEERDVLNFEILPGDGYNIGEGTISIGVEDGPSATPGEGPIVSLSATQTELKEGEEFTVNITVDESTGAIPEGGLQLFVDSGPTDVGEFVIFGENGIDPETDLVGIDDFPLQGDRNGGFFVTVVEPEASITLSVFDDGPNEGLEELVFTLADGELYEVAPDAAQITLTIDDSFVPAFGSIAGDTIEVEGSNQLIFGGAEGDLIDASITSGSGNRLYGSGGDDIFILGTGDRALGGDGDDQFYATDRGGNTITGGAGADQFWIATAEIPDAANIITDFTIGEDVLGIAGLGIGFEDLSITGQDDNTLIAASGSDLAILQGINADNLSADNFAFV